MSVYVIDTHCHLNFKVFQDTYHQVIERALSQNIGLIIVGAARDTSERAIRIAQEYPRDPVYAVVGQHPSHVTDEPFDYNWLVEVGKQDKVVAIGETGIDLYRPEEIASHALQKEFLRGHCAVAMEVDKPIVIHARGTLETLQTAIDDVLAVLSSSKPSHENRGVDSSFESGESRAARAVFHCFTGVASQAQQIVDAGYLISFTGVITFAQELAETVKAVPLATMMLETDAPYLSPVPYRGKQNEPVYVVEVGKKVAEIQAVEYDIVAQQTTENAEKFFKLNR